MTNCRLYLQCTNIRKHDKQDQQGKAAFNERNPQQQEPFDRSLGGPKNKQKKNNNNNNKNKKQQDRAFVQL
jgi:hypothetical protein